MASPIQQQTRIPYETAKDCSQGFCSIYCPQWCYIIFPPPPPPPFSFVDGDDSSGSTTFSPLVIAIIGILASAFLLVCYYTIVSKYCGGFRRRRSHRNPISPDDRVDDDDDGGGGGDQSRRHEANWHVPPSDGLDRALINKISVYKYRRGEGVVDGTDCSVCLGEFREDESLRLLPKCSHAFHLRCIDTWLSSHSNCPLCRANIASVNPAPPPDSPARPPPPPPESSGTTEGGQSDEMVVFVDDSGEETNSEVSDDDDDMPKEENHDIIEIRDDGNGGCGVRTIRMSFPMDSSNMGRISIADVLRQSMEDELVMEKDQGTCSSSRGETRSSYGQ